MRSAVANQRDPMPSADRVLAAVVEAAPAAIVGLDAAGSVTLWSPGAMRVFGWAAHEVIGRPAPMVAAAGGTDLAGVLGVAACDGAAEPRRLACVRRDGTRLDMLLSVAPIRGERQEVAGAILAFAEPPPDPASTLAPPGPYRMEALARFAAGVAHDVNNVLAAITGYATLVASSLPDDSPSQADVAEIRRATDRAARLTRQLLTFGRREGQVTQRLEVDEVVAGVEPMLRRLAGPDVRLIVKRSAESAATQTDREQLEQILANLVVNARDAMPGGGGEVEVATAAVDLDAAFVARHAGSTAGPHVRITVRDNGLGMDDVTLAHLFEPYFTTKPAAKGTGLGLAMVYGAVKQSGGYITAESRIGAGTTMTIHLPRR